MKKNAILVLLLTLYLVLAGCGQSDGTGNESANSESRTSARASTELAETSAGTGAVADGENVTEQAFETDPVIPTNSYPVFNFEKKNVMLNSGYEMPILGLGMFSLPDSEAENSTYWALKAGFRLIDTARIYGNEAAVGRGLQRAIRAS